MANSAFVLSSNVGSDGKSTRASKYQVDHGFSAGSVIRFVQEGDGITGAFLLAQATRGISAEAIGIVESVDAGGNEFTVVYGGEIDPTNFISTGDEGVTGHDVWFLDATVGGGLTSQAPTAAGQVVKPVLTLISGSQQYRGLVTNYVGTVIGGDNTVSLDSVHPVGEIIAFAGSTSDIPTGWQICDGSTLGVGGDYATYYSRIGTKYGYNYETVITDQNDTNFVGLTCSQQISSEKYEGKVLSFTASAGATASIIIDPGVMTGGISGGESSAGGYQYPHGVIWDNSPVTVTAAGGGTAYVQTGETPAASVVYVKTPDLRGRSILGATSDGVAGYQTFAAGLDGITQGAFGGAEDADTVVVTSDGAVRVYAAQSATNANLRQPFLAEHYIIRTTSTAKAALIDGVNVSLAIDGLTDVSSTDQSDGDILIRTGDATPVYKPLKVFSNGYPSSPGDFENAFAIRTTSGGYGNISIGGVGGDYGLHIRGESERVRVQDDSSGCKIDLGAFNDYGFIGTVTDDELRISVKDRSCIVIENSSDSYRINLNEPVECAGSVGITGDLEVGGELVWKGAAYVEDISAIAHNTNVQLETSNVFRRTFIDGETAIIVKNPADEKSGGMYTYIFDNTDNGSQVDFTSWGNQYLFANGIAPNAVRANQLLVVSLVCNKSGEMLCTWAEDFQSS